MNKILEKGILNSNEVEKAFISATRDIVKNNVEGGDEGSLDRVSFIISETVPHLADNTLWLLLNDIDAISEEKEIDSGLMSIRNVILMEQQRRCRNLQEDYDDQRSFSISIEMPDKKDDERNIKPNQIVFDQLSEERQNEEFDRGYDFLSYVLKSNFDNLCKEPFLMALLTLIGTYAKKNDYEFEKLLEEMVEMFNFVCK